MRPAVDIVILTWNDGALLDRAVSSALNSECVDVRVVVVDNGSRPPAEVPDDHRVQLVRNPENRGVATGRNQGVSVGQAPYVCLLDSDARLHADALAHLLDPLATDASVALTVPVFTDQAPTSSAGAAPSLLRKLARGLALTERYRAMRGDARGALLWEVDFGIGACQVFRRDAFDAVGGLDESIFYGPEDVDFCLRLRERGWRVLQVARAQVDHPPRRRNRRLFTRRGVQHGLAVVRYLRRHRATFHRR